MTYQAITYIRSGLMVWNQASASLLPNRWLQAWTRHSFFVVIYKQLTFHSLTMHISSTVLTPALSRWLGKIVIDILPLYPLGWMFFYDLIFFKINPWIIAEIFFPRKNLFQMLEFVILFKKQKWNVYFIAIRMINKKAFKTSLTVHYDIAAFLIFHERETS